MNLAIASLLWSLGFGNALLVTGTAGGPRNRADASIDVLPAGRLGHLGFGVALRCATYQPFADDGLVTGSIEYMAAAARPTVALVLHADAGVSLAAHAPVLGGGLETFFWPLPKILGPIALVFDVTGELVLDGVDGTRFEIASATRLSAAF